MITDTQVLSYYHKGALPAPSEPMTTIKLTTIRYFLLDFDIMERSWGRSRRRYAWNSTRGGMPRLASAERIN